MRITSFTLNLLANLGDQKALKARDDYKQLSEYSDEWWRMNAWYNVSDDSFTVAMVIKE